MFDRQLFPIRLALSLLGLLLVLNNVCAAEQSETKSDAEQQKQAQPADKEAAQPTSPKSEQMDIVAKIGDYVITKEELEKRVMTELRPNSYDRYTDQTKPVDVNEVLTIILAEKAIIMEARKQGLLQEEDTSTYITQFKDRRLASSVWRKYAQDNRSKFYTTKEEIDKLVKTNPKLDEKKATRLLQRQKANQLMNEYYNQLSKKFQLQKQSDNFPKAAEIHKRLLEHPKKPRKNWWITSIQFKEELTQQEKDIVLATYDNEKFALKDLFDALAGIAPPSRPKDLNTAKGVEKFLDKVLRMPIFVAEAKAQGLDKDKDLIEQVREREDRTLLGKAIGKKIKNINDPNEEQIAAYFEKNKEKFGTPNILKIDQIWCQDRDTAGKVKAELEGGKDFDSVKQEHSLQKKSKPYNTYPSTEGIFFNDLWKGEPNEIIGPIKGFYTDGIKWRIVKILEKNPAKIKEYSSDMNNNIKNCMMDEKRNAILADYRKELLQKYPHEIYTDRIKDIDPLNIP